MTNQWNAAVTPRMASSPSSPCCRAGSPSSWWASQQSRICTQFQIDVHEHVRDVPLPVLEVP